jgi:hypothetical protein
MQFIISHFPIDEKGFCPSTGISARMLFEAWVRRWAAWTYTHTVVVIEHDAPADAVHFLDHSCGGGVAAALLPPVRQEVNEGQFRVLTGGENCAQKTQLSVQ